jgi:hypothetical protein
MLKKHSTYAKLIVHKGKQGRSEGGTPLNFYRKIYHVWLKDPSSKLKHHCSRSSCGLSIAVCCDLRHRV